MSETGQTFPKCPKTPRQMWNHKYGFNCQISGKCTDLNSNYIPMILDTSYYIINMNT